MIKARVITCSDAASRGEREDRSGPAVRELLAKNGYDVDSVVVVPDDVDAIAGAITIRLLGSCDGCPSSSVTLKMAVEQAIHEGAPEVGHIVVDGWVEPEEPPVPAVPIELRPKPVGVGSR